MPGWDGRKFNTSSEKLSFFFFFSGHVSLASVLDHACKCKALVKVEDVSHQKPTHPLGQGLPSIDTVGTTKLWEQSEAAWLSNSLEKNIKKCTQLTAELQRQVQWRALSLASWQSVGFTT